MAKKKDKNYVTDEYERNVQWTGLYSQLLNRMWPGSTVLVSHHIFVAKKDKTVQEIPSADTVLFDPAIMGKVFGKSAPRRMAALSRLPPNKRERQVHRWLLGVR